MGLRLGAALTATLLTTPAIAGVLPIGGAFGDEAGCRFYLQGDEPSGDYALLTADTFASKALACDFEALASRTKSIFIVTATCSPGGTMKVSVVDQGPAGYLVRAGDASTSPGIGPLAIGPLAACPASPLDDTVQI